MLGYASIALTPAISGLLCEFPYISAGEAENLNRIELRRLWMRIPRCTGSGWP